MMTRQEQIKALEREYALKRENDEADRDRRVQSAAARFPDIGALLAEGRDIVRESARMLSGGIANASEAAREMRLRAEDRERERQRLSEAGIEVVYDEEFDCFRGVLTSDQILHFPCSPSFGYQINWTNHDSIADE